MQVVETSVSGAERTSTSAAWSSSTSTTPSWPSLEAQCRAVRSSLSSCSMSAPPWSRDVTTPACLFHSRGAHVDGRGGKARAASASASPRNSNSSRAEVRGRYGTTRFRRASGAALNWVCSTPKKFWHTKTGCTKKGYTKRGTPKGVHQKKGTRCVPLLGSMQGERRGAWKRETNSIPGQNKKKATTASTNCGCPLPVSCRVVLLRSGKDRADGRLNGRRCRLASPSSAYPSWAAHMSGVSPSPLSWTSGSAPCSRRSSTASRGAGTHMRGQHSSLEHR